MRLDEFTIGGHFFVTGPGSRPWKYRVTDVGTRTVAAIRVDETLIRSSVAGETARLGEPATRRVSEEVAERAGLFAGPPYGVLERLFDEDEREICYPDLESWAADHREPGRPGSADTEG